MQATPRNLANRIPNHFHRFVTIVFDVPRKVALELP